MTLGRHGPTAHPSPPTSLVLAVAAIILTASACTPTPNPGPGATTTTPGPTADVAVTQVVGGFSRPWEIAFTPDGTALVTERAGRISAVVGGVRQVVGTIPDVVALGEGGLMGMAVDPAFASNRRIYTCYASGSGGAVTDVRIVRFRVAEDLSELTDQTTILSGIPAGAGNRHLGCRVAIGPDGMLWATTGDAVVPNAPQDVTSKAGKVLRMTMGGAAATGNPGAGWDPYVYTRGHRNPQGLAFRPSDGAAFAVEHGTGCDDEVNLLTPGANYGWNPVGTGGAYDEGAPMTSPALGGVTPAVWSSGCPTIAPSGATFLSGTQWGGWNDQLVMAALKGRQLTFLRLDGSTILGTDTRLTAQGRLRTAVQGPDGSLWVAQDADPGALLRLAPA